MIVGNGGQEVDCRADEFFAVFAESRQAVAAAIAAQRALAAHQWPGQSSLQVRIGLNAGTPVVLEGAYVGLDVNRAARICSAGHGGQVLVSQTVRDALPDEADLRELGEYVLAGLPGREKVFQLVIPGGRVEFPPLRAPAASNRGWRELLQWRREPPPALGDTAWRVRSLLPDVAGDLRPAVAELGATLFAGERAADRADGFLSRIDHRRLASRLSEQRQMAASSPSAERETATIQTQITAIAEASNQRRALDECATRAFTLVNDRALVTRSALVAVCDRTDATTRALDDAVTLAAAVVDPLAFTLARTRSRGVYRSGDRYLVPYVDGLGADRVQDFATRAEAAEFRLAIHIAHANAPRNHDPTKWSF